jgi:hypothetical protein
MESQKPRDMEKEDYSDALNSIVTIPKTSTITDCLVEYYSTRILGLMYLASSLP